MIKIGVTGGLGSGKTTAARFFASKGAAIFDADYEAKVHMLHSNSLQKKLINMFGNSIRNSRNKLDFAALAAIAFENPLDQKILNGIIWPEVFLLVEKAAQKYESEGTKLFATDAALLIEAKYTHFFDYVLLITADYSTRIKRAHRRGNISDEQIKKRIKLQMTDEEKKPFASHWIENNGSIDQFISNLEAFYSGLSLH